MSQSCNVGGNTTILSKEIRIPSGFNETVVNVEASSNSGQTTNTSSSSSCCDDYVQVPNPDLPAQEEQAKLNEMSEFLFGESLDNSVDLNVSSCGWTRKEVALCCLRTRKFDSSRAACLYRDFSEWRRKMALNNGGLLTTRNISLRKILLKGVVQVLGITDIEGRPVISFRLARHDPHLWGTEIVLQLFAYVIERLLRSPVASIGHAAQMKGVCMIFDWGGVGFSNLDFRFPKEVLRVFGKKTPLRIGSILILNATTLCRVLLPIVRRLLPVKLRHRIAIVDPNESCLERFLPKDSIPAEYGGSQTFEPWYNSWVADQMTFDEENDNLLLSGPTFHNCEDAASDDDDRNCYESFSSHSS